MFRIKTVPDDAHKVSENSFEPIGSKYKFWFLDGGRRFLFKQVTPGTGEDWSEKVACELCKLLKIPNASYDLAVWRGNRGVVTANFVPSPGRIIFGNELLLKLHKDYPSPTGLRQYYRLTQHTLLRVLAVMRSREVQIPLGYRPPSAIATSLDVFIGYLMLDALIANQDRHHQNWALVYSPISGLHLAPTFDHASSLGRNESDETCLRRLAAADPQRGMLGYVEKARSAFHETPESPKPMSTLEAFRRAAKFRPRASNAWLQRLSLVTDGDFRAIFDKIPRDRISNPLVDFAVRMLELNRLRLLQLRGC